MTRYGKPEQEKGQHKLVPILIDGEAGEEPHIVGYAILDSDGNEIESFASWTEALAAFEVLPDDSAPPPPSGSGGMSFG